MFKSRSGENLKDPYFLTGKLIGPSNKGSRWSADSLLKTNFKFAGLSSGSSGKLAAVCD